MPLQQLVEYFNDRLQFEHNTNHRPFLLENKQVYGLFGAMHVSTQLLPLRETKALANIYGHLAQIKLTNAVSDKLQNLGLESLVPEIDENLLSTESIVNFDRLSRTVHMLNYLPHTHLNQLLFLNVDPRHILGVKADHGAYFEEVIIKCGLQTENVAIILAVNYQYANSFNALIKGLNNYQRRGYQIVLKFEHGNLNQNSLDLVARVSPNCVAISALDIERNKDNYLPEQLHKFNNLSQSLQAVSMLINIDDEKTALLAEQTDFQMVQGEIYEQLEQHKIKDKSASLQHELRVA